MATKNGKENFMILFVLSGRKTGIHLKGCTFFKGNEAIVLLHALGARKIYLVVQNNAHFTPSLKGAERYFLYFHPLGKG